MEPILGNEILLKAANEYGTPLYVYHKERILHQYSQLKQAFHRTDNSIFYACKALTNVNILRILAEAGSGIDCVSINELKLALLAGFAPEKIIFTPNSVGIAEYHEATAAGVNINIDNLHILEAFGRHYGDSYPVIIRLNPHIMAGGNLKISTGHVDSKFGISVEQVDKIIGVMQETNVVVKGLHLHTGSEIKDPEVFVRGLSLILGLTSRFPDLSIIDLGGGFKVPYKPDEKGTDMALLGQHLHDTLEAFRSETGKQFQIWFEPGKFLVSQCGYFLVKANVTKQGPSRTFVGVDSGFNHLIRPMFYDAYHKISNISNPLGENRTYNIVGNICETDTFAWDRELSEVRVGDVLLFNNAGAYGFEMSSRFNSRCRPAEILVEGDQTKVIRNRETFDDILAGVVLS
jgi:diaminopimelate decarboxylase